MLWRWLLNGCLVGVVLRRRKGGWRLLDTARQYIYRQIHPHTHTYAARTLDLPPSVQQRTDHLLGAWTRETRSLTAMGSRTMRVPSWLQ